MAQDNNTVDSVEEEDEVDSDVEYTELLVTTSSEVVAPPGTNAPIAKQGHVEIKDSKIGLAHGKTRWRSRWVILLKGSIHLFKNFDKVEPYHTIDLKDAEIIEFTGDGGRESSFGIKVGSNEPKYLTGSLQEMSAWKEALVSAKSLEPSLPPTRAVIPRSKRTSSPLFKGKKYVMGRAATTTIGKSMLKKLFGDEVNQLLDTIKKVLTKHESKEKATRMENCAIRLLIKISFQFEKKNITINDLISVDRSMREALELLSKYHNTRMRRYMRVHTDNECFIRVESLAMQAKEELVRSLQPYLTPKNLENLRFVFDTGANAKILQAVFNDQDLQEELDEIDDAITRYTQFHI